MWQLFSSVGNILCLVLKTGMYNIIPFLEIMCIQKERKLIKIVM